MDSYGAVVGVALPVVVQKVLVVVLGLFHPRAIMRVVTQAWICSIMDAVSSSEMAVPREAVILQHYLKGAHLI